MSSRKDAVVERAWFCSWWWPCASSLIVLAGCATPPAQEPAKPARSDNPPAQKATTAQPARSDPAPAPAAKPAQSPAPAPAAQPAPAADTTPAAKPVTTPPPSAAPATQPTTMSASEQAIRDMIMARLREKEAERAAAGQAPASQPQSTPPPPAKPTPPPPTPPRPMPATKPATSQPDDPTKPHLELDPDNFNFGDVWQGEPVKRDFTLKNSGGAPLTFDTKTSCGCTVATGGKSPLAPGESCTFTVSYNAAHAGPAQKTVTLTTNDPQRPQVVIQVSGKVNPLFSGGPTGERITFPELEPNAVATQTLRLENKYTEPVELRLRSGLDFGPFDVAFHEIEPGKVYEVTATTKPPLKYGWNSTSVILETGLKQMPTIAVTVGGNVAPRVTVMPAQLMIPMTTTQPTQQAVRVQYRLEKPLKITEIKATPDTIKCELVPAAQAQSGKLGYYQIRVQLPPAADLPEEGGKIEIFTDDLGGEFARLEVPVSRLNPAAPRNLNAAAHQGQQPPTPASARPVQRPAQPAQPPSAPPGDPK